MSKIEQLIKSLCPNGVKYYTLEDIVKEVNIGINPRKFFKLNPIDAVGFYVTVRELNGLSGVKQYEKTDTINEEAIKIINERAHIEKGDILFSNTGTVGKLALVNETPTNWGVNEGIYIIKPINKIINSKYLYYFLDSSHAYKDYSLKFTGSTLKHVTQKALLSLIVAVPPLEVQDEIVHILDDFTLLSAELSAELKAREKQYEYYKDKIWENVRDYKTEKMSNLCEIGDGLHGTPIYSEGTELWFINGNNLDNGKIIINSSTKEVSQESYNRHYIDMKKGSILLSINGTIGKTAYYNEEKVILGKSAAYFNIIDESRIIKEYLYFYLQSQDAMNYYECSKTGSTIKNLGLKALRDMNIPLPSIEKQNEIVNILSRFDKLCNDISEGLPAEIEARKKQYEYYRDKLLTFKELKVNEG